MERLRFLKRAVELSLESGGCIKFDPKAYDETLHTDLAGTPNACTLGNFRSAGDLCRGRAEPPPLIASTLRTPG